MTATIAKRLGKLESRVASFSPPRREPDHLGIFMNEHRDLRTLACHILRRLHNPKKEIPPWSRGEITLRHCEQLIELIHGGPLTWLAQEARKLIVELTGNEAATEAVA
jgi:hypothetical protein